MSPSASLFRDAGDRPQRAPGHFNASTLQQAIPLAGRRQDSRSGGSAHTLQHSFATHQNGCEVRRILGHTHIDTTMIHAHIVDSQQLAATGPLDAVVHADGAAIACDLAPSAGPAPATPDFRPCR